jgi:hypothetical protein
VKWGDSHLEISERAREDARKYRDDPAALIAKFRDRRLAQETTSTAVESIRQ